MTSIKIHKVYLGVLSSSGKEFMLSDPFSHLLGHCRRLGLRRGRAGLGDLVYHIFPQVNGIVLFSFLLTLRQITAGEPSCGKVSSGWPRFSCFLCMEPVESTLFALLGTCFFASSSWAWDGL